MTTLEIASQEHAAREAMAWVPEAYDVDVRATYLLKALVPAAVVLVMAAALLFLTF